MQAIGAALVNDEANADQEVIAYGLAHRLAGSSRVLVATAQVGAKDVVVAQAFGGSAMDLGVTQPAVSRMMSRFEQLMPDESPADGKRNTLEFSDYGIVLSVFMGGAVARIHAFNDRGNGYLGVGWEHEFDDKTRCNVAPGCP